MSPVDLTKTFCTVRARNDAASYALNLPHNAKFLVNSEPNEPQFKRTRQHGAEANRPKFPDWPTLALALDTSIFINPSKGIVFGSDHRRCDILLDVNNEHGTSGEHFTLEWTRGRPLVPHSMKITNYSSQGTSINDKEYSDSTTKILSDREAWTHECLGGRL